MAAVVGVVRGLASGKSIAKLLPRRSIPKHAEIVGFLPTIMQIIVGGCWAVGTCYTGEPMTDPTQPDQIDAVAATRRDLSLAFDGVTTAIRRALLRLLLSIPAAQRTGEQLAYELGRRMSAELSNEPEKRPSNRGGAWAPLPMRVEDNATILQWLKSAPNCDAVVAGRLAAVIDQTLRSYLAIAEAAIGVADLVRTWGALDQLLSQMPCDADYEDDDRELAALVFVTVAREWGTDGR